MSKRMSNKVIKLRKKVRGNYLPHSARIGFQEWNLEAAEEFANLLNKMCKEAFDIATAQYECAAWFPVDFSSTGDDGIGGPPVADPMVIHVALPIGPDEDEHPTWAFSLESLVTDLIDFNERGLGGPIDVESRPELAAVRDALHRLADTLDAALNRPEKE